DETHAVIAQQRVVLEPAADALVREVLRGQHGSDAWNLEGARGVDRDDAGMGVGAPHVLRPQHVRGRHVRRVLRAPRDLVGALDARDRLTDDAEGRCGCCHQGTSREVSANDTGALSVAAPQTLRYHWRCSPGSEATSD